MATEKKGKNSDGKLCSNCQLPAPKLSACSRCGLVAYCNKDCQRAHWKANHKQNCIARADRVPGHQNISGEDASCLGSSAIAAEKCAICQSLLSEATATTLPCAHVFHSTCVAELRKFGVQQVCPLCRTALPSGPEKSFVEATRKFTFLHSAVKQGFTSWSALPPRAQLDLDEVVSSWQAAAKEGYAPAQCNLGTSTKMALVSSRAI